jgi:hypothetical protein
MISIRPRSIFLRLCLLPLFVVMFAVVSNAQKSKPAPAPAPKAAPAAKPAAPPKTGGATTPHPTTAGGAARPGTTGASTAHGGTTAGGAAKGGTTAAGGAKGGTTAAGGAKGGATAAGGAKGGTTAAGGAKGGTTAAGGAKGGTTAAGGAKGGTTAAGGAKGGAAGGAGTKGGATAAKAPGTVTHPGGGKSVTNAAGNTKDFNKSGKMTGVSTKSGHTASFDSHGRVTSVHTAHGATISHGPHGERRVVGERVNARGEHYHVVNYGGHRGYVEHGYMRGGHPYMRRTYMYGGRRYAYAYRGGYYRGVAYYGYAAPYYYPPAYYGWAYNPWPAPVAYGWGWGAAPWYGFYGGYFAPAPVYPIAALWLTDYLIAENLRLAYEAAQASDPNAANRPEFAPYMVPSGATADGVSGFGGGMEFNADAAAAALSPDVKQLVSDDLKAQLAEVQAEASNPSSASGSGGDEVPAALNPKHRIFVVSATLDVPSGDDTCALTPGDIVQRQENEPGDDKAVAVKVLSAKSEGCAVGSVVRIQVTDLQDMHNDFREKLDTGLDTLAKGGNGLPKAPDATHKINPDGQAQPDLNADDDLKAQQADADAADKEVQAAAQPDKP